MELTNCWEAAILHCQSRQQHTHKTLRTRSRSMTSPFHHYRRQLPSYLGWTIALAAIISLLRVFLSPITISIIADEFTLRPSPFSTDPSCTSNDKYYDPHRVICFVTASYASNSHDLDEITNVTKLRLDNPSFRFVLFTNLDDIKAPGWTSIVTHLPYRRFITHSRYGKFVGWKEPLLVEMCSVVFYMDAHRSPVQFPSYWNLVSHQILRSKDGLMQVLHKTHKKAKEEEEEGNNDGGSSNSLVLNEYQRILSKSKDIASNLNKQVEWLKKQPDFDPINTKLYFNGHFGYDPKNPRFRQVSEAFWNRYSQEIDSWRDQPLWAYFIHKYDIQPLPLPANTTEADDVFLKTGKVGHGGHEYTQDADSDALVWYSNRDKNKKQGSNAVVTQQQPVKLDDGQRHDLPSRPSSSSIEEQFKCILVDQDATAINAANRLGCIFQRLQQVLPDTTAKRPGAGLVYVDQYSHKVDSTNTTIRITTASSLPTLASSIHGEQQGVKEISSKTFDERVVVDSLEIPSDMIISAMRYFGFELISFDKKENGDGSINQVGVDVGDGNGSTVDSVSSKKVEDNKESSYDEVVIRSIYRRIPSATR